MTSFWSLKREIGEDLANRLLEVFDSKKSATEWYYNTRPLALGSKTPHEAYQKGMKKEIDELLGRIEHGIFS